MQTSFSPTKDFPTAAPLRSRGSGRCSIEGNSTALREKASEREIGVRACFPEKQAGKGRAGKAGQGMTVAGLGMIRYQQRVSALWLTAHKTQATGERICKLPCDLLLFSWF
jgi:hypothetical protein